MRSLSTTVAWKILGGTGTDTVVGAESLYIGSRFAQLQQNMSADLSVSWIQNNTPGGSRLAHLFPRERTNTSYQGAKLSPARAGVDGGLHETFLPPCLWMKRARGVLLSRAPQQRDTHAKNRFGHTKMSGLARLFMDKPGRRGQRGGFNPVELAAFFQETSFSLVNFCFFGMFHSWSAHATTQFCAWWCVGRGRWSGWARHQATAVILDDRPACNNSTAYVVCECEK